MRVVQVPVYTFDELSDSAKERARQWWRDAMGSEDYAEFCLDDFGEIAERLGVELRTRPVALMSGKTRQDPCVFWSGFSSQGDGASFEGRYRSTGTALERVKDHAPLDAELSCIAAKLDEVHRLAGCAVTSKITTRGMYSHSHSMDFETELQSEDPDWVFPEGLERLLAEALRGLADWLYRQLEEEYTYQSSDEVVDENLEANQYTFTAEGKRFG